MPKVSVLDANLNDEQIGVYKKTVDDVVSLLLEIEAKKLEIKEAADEVAEEFGIKASDITSDAKIVLKQNLKELDKKHQDQKERLSLIGFELDEDDE